MNKKGLKIREQNFPNELWLSIFLFMTPSMSCMLISKVLYLDIFANEDSFYWKEQCYQIHLDGKSKKLHETLTYKKLYKISSNVPNLKRVPEFDGNTNYKTIKWGIYGLDNHDKLSIISAIQRMHYKINNYLFLEFIVDKWKSDNEGVVSNVANQIWFAQSYGGRSLNYKLNPCSVREISVGLCLYDPHVPSNNFNELRFNSNGSSVQQYYPGFKYRNSINETWYLMHYLLEYNVPHIYFVEYIKKDTDRQKRTVLTDRLREYCKKKGIHYVSCVEGEETILYCQIMRQIRSLYSVSPNTEKDTNNQNSSKIWRCFYSNKLTIVLIVSLFMFFSYCFYCCAKK